MTGRLIAGYLLLTAALLGILMVPLALTHRDNLERDLLLRMERDAVVLASLLQQDLQARPADRDRIATTVMSYAHETGARVAVTDADGTLMGDSDPTEPGARDFRGRPEIDRALAGRVATGTRHSATLGTDLLFVSVPVAAGGQVFGSVRITYTGGQISRRTRMYWLLLAAIAAVTLIAVVVIATVIARWVSRPLARLETSARAVGAGDLSARAPEDRGPPEVRALAHRFNLTVAQLERLVGAQEAFVADASHQLRTPLTAIRLRIESLEHASGETGREDARAALGEVDRMARLVDGLLALARADRAQESGDPCDLTALVEERLTAWRGPAGDAEVALESRVAPGLRVRVARSSLEQALDNLIDNAVRASPPRATVTLEATVEPDLVRLAIVDHGPGLDPSERQHAFERFWRAADAPTGEGSGLGLAIVRRLVESAGGQVRLDETPGGGLSAVMLLPRERH